MIKTMLHPVQDMDKAKRVYTALLGTEPQVDESYYVGYELDGLHVGLVPNQNQSMGAPVAYWEVDDIAAKLDELTAAGASVQQEPHNVGGSRVVATVADADGNVFGLLQD